MRTRQGAPRTELSTLSKSLVSSPSTTQFQEEQIPVLDSEQGHDSPRPRPREVVGAVGIRTLELTTRRHRTMARHCCLRVFATAVHILNAMAAGVMCFYALVGILDDKECLPPLVNSFGDSVKFTSGLPTMCNTTHCLMAAIFLLNILMIIGVNCVIQSTCMMVTHLVFAIGMAICAVFGATVFSVHYMLWCDSLVSQKGVLHDKCKSAANYYDNIHTAKNMTWYYNRLELQQVGLWTISDLMILTVIVYLIVTRLVSQNQTTPTEDNTDNPPSSGNFRYVILSEESTPLVNPLSGSSCNDFIRESYVHREPPPRYQAYQAQVERQTSPAPRSRGSSYLSGLNPFNADTTPSAATETQGPENTGDMPRYVRIQEDSHPLLTPAPANDGGDDPSCPSGMLIDLEDDGDNPPTYHQVETNPERGTTGARSASFVNDSVNLLH